MQLSKQCDEWFGNDYSQTNGMFAFDLHHCCFWTNLLFQSNSRKFLKTWISLHSPPILPLLHGRSFQDKEFQVPKKQFSQLLTQKTIEWHLKPTMQALKCLQVVNLPREKCENHVSVNRNRKVHRPNPKTAKCLK